MKWTVMNQPSGWGCITYNCVMFFLESWFFMMSSLCVLKGICSYCPQVSPDVMTSHPGIAVHFSVWCLGFKIKSAMCNQITCGFRRFPSGNLFPLSKETAGNIQCESQLICFEEQCTWFSVAAVVCHFGNMISWSTNMVQILLGFI